MRPFFRAKSRDPENKSVENRAAVTHFDQPQTLVHSRGVKPAEGGLKNNLGIVIQNEPRKGILISEGSKKGTAKQGNGQSPNTAKSEIKTVPSLDRPAVSQNPAPDAITRAEEKIKKH
jgi:hypothetical protein